MVTLTGLGGLGKVRAHTKSVATEFSTRFRVLQFWGNGATGSHHEGRALDIMVFTNSSLATSRSLGEAIYKAVWADRVRLGVEYIIWNRTITSTVVAPGQRRPYLPVPGKKYNPHTDHVHVTFLDKPPAYRPFLSPRAIGPSYFNEAWEKDNKPGTKAPSHPVGTKYGQLALNVALGLQLDPDGWHGPATHRAMQSYQKKLGDPATDHFTWAQWDKLGEETGVFTFTPPPPPPPPVVLPPPPEVSLAQTIPHKRSVSHLQRALNKVVGSDCHGGLYDAETEEAVKKWQARLGHPADGSLSLAEWKELATASGTFIAKP
jgi:hypothetical protein